MINILNFTTYKYLQIAILVAMALSIVTGSMLGLVGTGFLLVLNAIEEQTKKMIEEVEFVIDAENEEEKLDENKQ